MSRPMNFADGDTGNLEEMARRLLELHYCTCECHVVLRDCHTFYIESMTGYFIQIVSSTTRGMPALGERLRVRTLVLVLLLLSNVIFSPTLTNETYAPYRFRFSVRQTINSTPPRPLHHSHPRSQPQRQLTLRSLPILHHSSRSNIITASSTGIKAPTQD